jgi:hypothetical protein
VGKYLVLWELDESRLPIDPKERGAAWAMSMAMVKNDLATGTATDWGAFVGAHQGYTIHEGTEVEVGVTMQQYVPFVKFKVIPIASVDQVSQVVAAIQG